MNASSKSQVAQSLTRIVVVGHDGPNDLIATMNPTSYLPRRIHYANTIDLLYFVFDILNVKCSLLRNTQESVNGEKLLPVRDFSHL